MTASEIRWLAGCGRMYSVTHAPHSCHLKFQVLANGGLLALKPTHTIGQEPPVADPPEQSFERLLHF